MVFNKQINKKAILVKAKKGLKDEIINENNSIIFSFKKNLSNLVKFSRKYSTILLKNKGKDLTVDINSFLSISKVNNLDLVVLLLTKIGQFSEEIITFKSDYKKPTINVIFDKKYKDIVAFATKLVEGFTLAKKYQLLPVNYLGINDFAKEVKKTFASLSNKKVNVKVLGINELKREEMGLLQAVNKGSDEPAAMVIIEYFNNPSSKDLLAYVGKGIMYDAGGYELKPSKFMEGMNQDMTGAATVFGTLYGLVATNQKVNVVGLLPLAKNLINDKSMMIGDVYKAANGKTVEITSPDSEGRLILADAIAYANKHYELSKIFTVATLTGLSSIAFGDYLTPY